MGGIRSTGLSAATGIAEYVAEEMYAKELRGGSSSSSGSVAATSSASPHASLSGEETLMGVSVSTENTLPPAPPPLERSDGQLALPLHRFGTLPEICEQFSTRRAAQLSPSEPTYLQFNGFKYRVTHPISSFGMENYQYICDIHEKRRADE